MNEDLKAAIEREIAVVEKYSQNDPPWMGGSPERPLVLDLIEGNGQVKSQEQEYAELGERLRQYDLEDEAHGGGGDA